MKKLALSVFMAWIITLANSSNCFAKTPEIVNPPRPNARFKWLLVVEHSHEPSHTKITTYLYTDKYHIFKESDGWIWIVPEGRFEAFYKDNQGEVPELPDTPVFILTYPQISRYFIFLRSKAPESQAFEKKSGRILSNGSDVKRSWMKDAKKIKLKARKAKIVFK